MSRRSKSSDRWLKEHFSDPFVQRAQSEGWRSRAVFKLEEIDRRERLLKPGQTCLDLGAAPGAWSQYARRRVGRNGRVVATDMLAMPLLRGVEFVLGDICEQDDASQVVIFVKGTTDALNRIAAEQARLDGRQVLVTEMEHHADLLPWRHRSGHVMVGLSEDGHIDLDAIEHALTSGGGKIGLVAVCGASNVTGFVSPIHEVAELAHRHGALISIDAAQLAPHHRIDIRPASDPGHLDFVSLSGHKMYAPYGAGVLVAPRSFFAGAPEVMGGGAELFALGDQRPEDVVLQIWSAQLRIILG